ncbi:MAG TPA: endonuclease [Nitrospirales bacterium]|nr:endonuclease [Nitrospirales bacterium]
MRFRVITYNIHKGVGGVDRRYQLARIIDTLAFYEPDIALLQEVADGIPRSGHHQQVDVLGETLGFQHRAYQPNVTLRKGAHGNAILSRFPLSDIHDIDLTIPLKKRRRSLAATCHLSIGKHSSPLLIYNFHLGLVSFERTIQIRRFLANATFQKLKTTAPVIVAGDFNDLWATLGKRLLEPAGFQIASGLSKTFPAFRPVRPLDHVFFRGNLILHHCFPSRIKVAKRASDHLPIIADFEIHPP